MGDGGGVRLGSNFGCKVLVPLGPLNETSRGLMRSTRHPLTVSPSLTTSAFAPSGAKIAIRWPGTTTIPVSLVSASPESAAALSPPRGGGRRVLLNNGRARIVANSSLYRPGGSGRVEGGAGSGGGDAMLTGSSRSGVRAISAVMIAAARAQPASKSTEDQAVDHGSPGEDALSMRNP